MIGKTVHLRVETAGELGTGCLVWATQHYDGREFKGPVMVKDEAWSSDLNIFFVGLPSARIGDFITKGVVGGYVPERKQMIVNCIQPTGPEESVADVEMLGTVAKDQPVRMWRCDPPDMTECREEARTPTPPRPEVEIREPPTGTQGGEDKEGLKSAPVEEEVNQRNVRPRTEATGGPKEAEVIAGKVEVASNKVKEPASASPSQSEYTYSPTDH